MKAAREHRSKAFRLAFEMIFVFGIPAAIAVFGGGYLDERFNTGSTITLVGLALAFIISWIIVFVRVRAFSQSMPVQPKQSKQPEAADEDEANPQ